MRWRLTAVLTSPVTCLLEVDSRDWDRDDTQDEGRKKMMGASISRRMVLREAAAATMLAAGERPRLAQWTPGELDIHHISTGRGSCAFMICPDGTTMMVDAGSAAVDNAIRKYIIDALPNERRSPGQWIARYVQRQLAGIRDPAIDTFVGSHLHGDHIGAVGPNAPISSDGTYRLTGISEVASLVPVHKVIDRGYPRYDYPAPPEEPSWKNYVAFVSAHVRRGGRAERIIVGSSDQIRLLRNPSARPAFSVRNIAANGELWTGEGTATRHLFPPLSDLERRQYPTENMCSVGVRLSYGKFRYYTPGDMSSDTTYGRYPWRDIETAAAQAAGPVDVAVASHHGYCDATGAGFVRALSPRAFVVNAWDSAHPTINPLHNMLSRELYPGESDVYTTAIKPESLIAIRRLAELKSNSGHVVFRVAEGGASFRVFITSNTDELDFIWKSFGPYQSKA